MVKQNGASASPEPAIPLGYGRGNAGGDFGRRFMAGVNERADGAAEFVGMLVAAAGGRRQVMLAFGMAFAAYGLGLVLARPEAAGPGWLGLGAFLIGLLLPVPARQPGGGGGPNSGGRAARDASSPK